MAEKEFYKLNWWQKFLICIGVFSTVLGGLYYFIHWVKSIGNNIFANNDVPTWALFAIGTLLLCLGLLFTYVAIWTNSTFGIFRKAYEAAKNGKAGKENISEQIDIVRKEQRLGEIEHYWSNREVANMKIKEYLSTTPSNTIFIAAIGFGTIPVLTDTEVILNFTKKIQQEHSSFKITFVIPNINNLKKVRPEITEQELKENYNNGIELLRNFRNKLADSCFNSHTNKQVKIAQYVNFRHYDDNSIPRHFILQGDDGIIFIGGYLGCTIGRQSYLMKLKKYEKEENNKGNLSGLHNLFTNEIKYIKNIENNNLQIII